MTYHFQVEIKPRLMEQLFEKKNSSLNVALLEIIGKYQYEGYDSTIITFLESEDEALRYHALYAGCKLDIAQAKVMLEENSIKNPHYQMQTQALFYALSQKGKLLTVEEALAHEYETIREQLYAFAMLGYVGLVPFIIERMHNLEEALCAGEAFSFITGIDLDDEDLIRVENITEEEESTLRAAQKADRWSRDYEDDLPLVDVELVQTWWSEHQNDFPAQTRLIDGKAYNNENLKIIVEKGTGTQREIARLLLEFL